MRGGLKMKKTRIAALCALLTLGTAGISQAAFTVGGENGWQLSTDGIVDIFATYMSSSPNPKAVTNLNLLGTGAPSGQYDQRFNVGVGLLPSIIALNVKAPTVNGVESTVRVGIYPSVQNSGTNSDLANHFSTSPNVDFREFFYTAKGAYGELLAGRALNLYQGKNILTDMTLLTAGTVGSRGNTTTLGHIAYGYLYANFGPQFRYTTPDFGGLKFALEVAEPYAISADTAKNNSPRVEAELSYAKVFGATSVQGWLSGMYQNAIRKDSTVAAPVARGGKDNESIGGAYGLGVGFGGLNLLGSGYGGKGLGMVSTQDGATFDTAVDPGGKERLFWGFLVQATYQLTPAWKIGANYGQTRCEETNLDAINRSLATYGTASNKSLIKKQESGVAMVVYNLNKFTQFIGEYIYAQNTWHDGESQHSNQVSLGTMFYW
jgi:predicted porin